MKIYKWPDLPYSFSPIYCRVKINNEKHGLLIFMHIQGGPERSCHTYDHIISRKRGTEWKSPVLHYCSVWIFFIPCTHDVHHRSFKVRWRRFDSVAVFLSQCHFPRFALLSQKSQFMVLNIFHCVASQRVNCQLLLCKTFAWIFLFLIVLLLEGAWADIGLYYTIMIFWCHAFII